MCILSFNGVYALTQDSPDYYPCFYYLILCPMGSDFHNLRIVQYGHNNNAFSLYPKTEENIIQESNRPGVDGPVRESHNLR